MIPQSNSRVLESTVTPKKIVGYHVDPKNLRQIFQMLREMYSDPKLAVVREYSANGRDAHVTAGIPHRPIEITMPTVADPVMTWRDFGFGLDNDSLEALFLGYGASGDEKRKSNELIGGFGIGGKCGFAVADQFTVISYHAGRRNEWQCYRDQDDDCQAMLIDTKDSTEPSGIEVRIPVPWQEVSEYAERIENAFLFYPVRPVLFRADKSIVDRVNRTLPAPFLHGNLKTTDRDGHEIPIRWEAVKDPDYKDFQVGTTAASDLSFARVVMGGIAYPIQLERLGVSGGATETFFRRIILYAPIGSMQLAPSREALAYTPRVINMLKCVFGEIINQSGETAMTAISAAKQCKDKLNILSSLHAAIPRLADLTKELIERFFIGVNGLAVPLKDVVCVKTFTKGQIYAMFSGNYKYAWAWTSQNHNNAARAGTHMVPADSGNLNLLVVVVEGMTEEHKNKHRDIAARVFARITGDKNADKAGTDAKLVLIGASKDIVATIPWMTDGSVRRLTIEELDNTSVPVDIREEFYRTSGSDEDEAANSKKSRVSNSVAYAQHSKKFVRIDTTASQSRTFSCSVRSQDWVPVTARSLENTRKVFVLHEGFCPQASYKGFGFLPIAHLRRVIDGAAHIPAMLDMKTSGILGVRPRDYESIRGKSDFVLFWDYMEEVYSKLKADGLTDVCFVQTWLMVRALVQDCNRGCENASLQWVILQNGYRWVDENPSLLRSEDPLAKAVCEFRAATRYLLGNPAGLTIFRHFVMPLFWLAKSSRLGLVDLGILLGFSYKEKTHEVEDTPIVFSSKGDVEMVAWCDDKSLYAKMVKCLHEKPGFRRYLAVSSDRQNRGSLTWLHGNEELLPENPITYHSFTDPEFDTFPVSDFIDLSGEDGSEKT